MKLMKPTSSLASQRPIQFGAAIDRIHGELTGPFDWRSGGFDRRQRQEQLKDFNAIPHQR